MIIWKLIVWGFWKYVRHNTNYYPILFKTWCCRSFCISLMQKYHNDICSKISHKFSYLVFYIPCSLACSTCGPSSPISWSPISRTWQCKVHNSLMYFAIVNKSFAFLLIFFSTFFHLLCWIFTVSAYCIVLFLIDFPLLRRIFVFLLTSICFLSRTQNFWLSYLKVCLFFTHSRCSN